MFFAPPLQRSNVCATEASDRAPEVTSWHDQRAGSVDARVSAHMTRKNRLPPEVPALPSFKLHKFVSQKIAERGRGITAHAGHQRSLSGTCSRP